ncbi:uncharacterized protein LOC129311455 [Prosopis cineraria]|uniref:uncharacterized protein LOC129311455 n=1 Tax=Prosopis cineraria TaxID=364024 RepID=UPI00240F4506|nr:uncharacterized protein LOC129311455 [Prosopis cineraria]
MKRELEAAILDKAGEVISTMKSSKHVDQGSAVDCCSAFSRNILDFSPIMVVAIEVHLAEEQADWWQAFYQGIAFPTFARCFLLDMLSSEVTSQVLCHAQRCLPSNDSLTEELLESNPNSVFWLRMMEAIRDPYAVERISEQILHQLTSRHADDTPTYWAPWLFHRTVKHQASVRNSRGAIIKFNDHWLFNKGMGLIKIAVIM